MRNINTKILNLAIFKKLIFGIFTAIFVGLKRDKIGHIGQNTQLQNQYIKGCGAGIHPRFAREKLKFNH